MFGPNSTQWQSSTPTLFLRSKVSAGRIQALAPGWWLVRGQTNGIKGELSSLIHTGTSYFGRCELEFTVLTFNIGLQQILCVSITIIGQSPSNRSLHKKHKAKRKSETRIQLERLTLYLTYPKYSILTLN